MDQDLQYSSEDNFARTQYDTANISDETGMPGSTINKLSLIEILNWIDTALCNHNRIVFEKMSSWTALTWPNRDENSILYQIYQKQLFIKSGLRKCILKEMQHSQQGTHKIGF